MNKSIQLIVFSMLLFCVVQSTPVLKENKTDITRSLVDKPELKLVKARSSVINIDDEDVKPVHKLSVDEDVKPVHKLSVDEDDKPVHKLSVDEDDKPVHKLSVDEDDKPVHKLSVDEDVKPVHKFSVDEDVKPVHKLSVDEDVKPVHKLSVDEDVKLVQKDSVEEDVKPIKKLSVDEDVKPVHKDSVDEDEKPIRKLLVKENIKPINKDSFDEDVKPVHKLSVDEDVKSIEKDSVDELDSKKVLPKKHITTSKPIKKTTTEATDIDADLTTEKPVKKLSVESSDDDSETPKDIKKKVESTDDSDAEKSEETSDEKKDEKKRATPELKSSENITITPCESSPEFKYYQPHPTDPTKYYICDPWGTGLIQSCSNDLVWNNWFLKCDKLEEVKNITMSFPMLQTNTTKTLLKCNETEFQCLNDGVCTETSGFYKCVCTKDYTGEFCESRIDITDLTHDILDGKFSVVDYKLRLVEENITMEMDYYRRYKDQLDNVTYGELMKYLSIYKSGEIRYDTLINRLIEDILHDIYPDAEYLSSFNASSQYVVSMIKLMPSLLSYSRYSFERYDQVFAQYQKVLGFLVTNLNRTLPVLEKEATEYVTLTEVFLNQTVITLNQTMSESRTLMVENSSKKNIQLSEKDITEDLKINFNATLKATELLFEKIGKFNEKVLKKMETDPKIFTVLLSDCKIEGAQELIELFNDIASSSAQVWDSLVNYGFWFITNSFSNTIKRDNADKFQLSLN